MQNDCVSTFLHKSATLYLHRPRAPQLKACSPDTINLPAVNSLRRQLQINQTSFKSMKKTFWGTSDVLPTIGHWVPLIWSKKNSYFDNIFFAKQEGRHYANTKNVFYCLR